MRRNWRGTGRCVHFPCLSQRRLPPPPSVKTRAAMTWSGMLRWEGMKTHSLHPNRRKKKWDYQQAYSPVSNLISLPSHLSSLLPRLQSRCLLLSPPNRKALALCPTANKASTQAPFLRPSPTASSPRRPRAAALSHPHRARHSHYPPSRTLHPQPQYGPSPQSCPHPKTPAWVSPRP